MHQNCEDERAERIIEITKNTCLMALDKTLYQIINCKSYSLSANMMLPLCDAINRAITETKKMAI